MGIFAAEGGQFIAGHAKLRTAAGLSALWDVEPIKRVLRRSRRVAVGAVAIWPAPR